MEHRRLQTMRHSERQFSPKKVMPFGMYGSNARLKRLFVIFIIGIAFFVTGGVSGYYFSKRQFIVPPSKGCTLEARICPDGSAVGRTGPNCEFSACPAISATGAPIQISPTYAQVSTAPTKPPMRVTLLDTSDWKSVENNGVRFKIPANAKCNNDTACTEVTYPNIYQGKELPLPARILITVTDYLGGSRRDQYFTMHSGDQECKPIVVETSFGSVSALQIAVDGGWCQGGYNGSIVAVIGKKFVVIGPGLSYHENMEISRWDIRDTLVSTLTSK